ncbi:MAG: LysE family transporter [Chloroflexi bacterium]|nr:LysE family transporter [Chloroflexota bacterium]
MAAFESFVFVFAASFSIGLSGAMSPGPLTVFVMGQSARYGIVAGPLASLGHGLLEAALVVLLWLGLARVLQWDPVLAAIGVVGGLVMIWMGWQIVSGVRRKGARLAESVSDKHADHPMVGGALLSLANPYWSFWWATVGISTMTTLALPRGATGLAAFTLGHVASDFLWLTLVAIVFATGRRFISDRMYQSALYLFGMVLALFGLYFIWFGVMKLLSP